MKTTTRPVVALLLLTFLFAACSRPVAYFQKSPRAYHATAPTVASSEISPARVATMPVEASAPAVITAPTEPVTPAASALNQVDALARNDGKAVATDKSLQKRMNRVQALLAPASLKAAAVPSGVGASRKANLMERLMVKKLNRTINRQLAPANPSKPMLNTGILATGAVLVLIGLLLAILTSGTAATVGIIVLIVGAVLLLLGLL